MPDHVTDDAVVIVRDVDATPDVVWSMWTDPDHFRAWYGPDGATIPVARFDLRPGGERVVAMSVHTPTGARTMWFSGTHQELDQPRVLVYTETMTSTDGGAPESPQTEVRVELEPLERGRTRVRLTHHGVPAGSPGAAGWDMALTKLAAALR